MATPPETSSQRPLSARQRAFVAHLLDGADATQAARAAGYCPSRADRAGKRLCALPQVQAALAAAREDARPGECLDERHVRRELARIAFADISDFLRWDGEGVHLRPMDELDRDQTACVAEIVESAGKTGGKTVRVKLHGKLAALAALSRLLAGKATANEAGPRQIVVVTSVPEPAPLPDPDHPENAGWPPAGSDDPAGTA